MNCEGGEQETDCTSCKMPVLNPRNREVWMIYQMINTQFVYDFGGLKLVFEVMGLTLTREEAVWLLQDMIMIHQMLKEHEKKRQEKELNNQKRKLRHGR